MALRNSIKVWRRKPAALGHECDPPRGPNSPLNSIPVRSSLIPLVLGGAIFLLAAGQTCGVLPKKAEYIDAAGALLCFVAALSLIRLIRRHARQRWREMLTVALTVAACFVALNWILFFLRPEMAFMPYVHLRSQQYHHEMPARATMRMMTETGAVYAHTNEDGLRTRYSREEFRQYKTRILVLGDSFTFGVLVPQESTFSEVAETLLRHSLDRQDIAVLNAGVVSYSPYVENLLLEGKLRAYQPNIILLFLDVTDFGDDYHYQHVARIVDDHVCFYRKPIPFIGHYCALQEFTRPYSDCLLHYVLYPKTFWDLHVRYHPPEDVPDFDYYGFQVTIDGELETNRYFVYRHPLASIEPFLRNTMENVNHIADQAQACGASFAVLIYPRYHLWNTSESPENWERGLYRLNEPYPFEYFTFFDKIKDSTPYPIVNMLPVFQATTEFPLCFRGDAHWNARGHAFVACFLADYLIKSGMVN